jgi:hypothetical protein
MSTPNCPGCPLGDIARSRWRWFELPLVLLLMRPYRCVYCGKRFFAGMQ